MRQTGISIPIANDDDMASMRPTYLSACELAIFGAGDAQSARTCLLPCCRRMLTRACYSDCAPSVFAVVASLWRGCANVGMPPIIDRSRLARRRRKRGAWWRVRDKCAQRTDDCLICNSRSWTRQKAQMRCSSWQKQIVFHQTPEDSTGSVERALGRARGDQLVRGSE